jgi:hypothetical protein
MARAHVTLTPARPNSLRTEDLILVALDGLVPGPSDQSTDTHGGRRPRRARRSVGGAGPARGGVAGGLPGLRSQPATNPQQPRGALAWRRVWAAPSEPVHRRVQRPDTGVCPDSSEPMAPSRADDRRGARRCCWPTSLPTYPVLGPTCGSPVA